MHISTFTGSDEDIAGAIERAEQGAQALLDSLGKHELTSVQAQTITIGYEGIFRFLHIITVVYE